MDPGFHIGFSGHVTNSNPDCQIPQFPLPGYELESMAQSAQTYPGGHGPPAIGFYPTLSHMTNVPTPYYMTGSMAPYHTPGILEASPMFGTPVSHHVTNTSGSTPMTTTSAHHDTTITPSSHHITSTAALPPSYGFITNNWIEEQHSWYPEEPPPAEEATSDLELSNPTNVEGFRIGFENFGHFSNIDPAAHYHQINFPSGTFLTPNVGDRMLERRQSLREDAWQGDWEGQQTRRYSMYDIQPGDPNYYQQSQIADWKISITETSSNKNMEFTAFCQSVKLIRSKFSAADSSTNPGRLWSVAIPFPDKVEDSEVEISVYVDNLQTPLQFVQRNTVRIEELISDILNKLHPAVSSLYPSLHTTDQFPPNYYYPDQNQYDLKQNLQQPSQRLYPSLNFSSQETQESPPYQPDPNRKVAFLRICGRDEYLQGKFSLRSHSSLQRLSCIYLQLHDGSAPSPFARSEEDDRKQLELSDRQQHHQYWTELRKRLHRAICQYEERVQHYLYNQHAGTGNLLEAVKEICYLLRSVETKDVSVAVQCIRAACYQQPDQTWTSPLQGKAPAQNAVTMLSLAISRLINIYSRSFCADFESGSPDQLPSSVETQDQLSFHLYAAHNLPDNWANSQNSVFYISCSVTYSGRKICPEIRSGNVKATKSLFSRLVWDEVMMFPLPLAALPFETMLVLRLYVVTDTSSSFLAWSCLPLYSTQQIARGSLLLSMISHAEPPPSITPGAWDITLPTLITIQVGLPDRVHTFCRPATDNSYSGVTFQDPNRQMEFLAQRGSVLLLSQADKQCLWQYRHCAYKPQGTLPLLLGSAPSWDPPSVSAMYRLLQDWNFSCPLEGLSLLSPCFSDGNIRDTACRQIGRLSDDELLEFLPQLVQL